MSKNWPDAYEQMEEGRKLKAKHIAVLEEILNNSILTMYHKLGGGRDNYGKRLGRMEVRKLEFGKMGIMYFPSEEIKKEGCQEGIVATINLEDKTYTPQWNGDMAEFKTIPYVVMNDTELVMETLGLQKKN
ncbi:MAG: hypothetical protein V1645_03715 [archaeon]